MPVEKAAPERACRAYSSRPRLVNAGFLRSPRAPLNGITLVFTASRSALTLALKLRATSFPQGRAFRRSIHARVIHRPATRRTGVRRADRRAGRARAVRPPAPGAVIGRGRRGAAVRL